MTSEQWERLRALFHQAVDLPPDQRHGFLERACSDLATRSLVENLLASTDDASSLLGAPAVDGARELIQKAISTPVIEREQRAAELIGLMIAERYQLHELLGKGGHALVFLAIDQKLGNKKVVVKVLDAESDHRIWLEKKFRQEIEILGRITHPGIVGVQDCGMLPDGVPFLVMDFVDGVSLRQRLRNPVVVPEAAEIIRQIGLALHAAHAQGIAHRDVKPENIMLQPVEAGRPMVKLIDFGIAQVQRRPGASNTTVAMIAGTSRYMAPEQYLGLATFASDIYSFGVVCVELLTGSLDHKESVPDHRTEVLERLTSATGLPPDARSLLRAALAFDPDKRPQDARVFGNSLAHALLEKGYGWTRIPKIVAVALCILSLAIGGLWISQRRPTPRNNVAPAPQQLTPDGELSVDPALSPSGDMLAYASDHGERGPLQIWVQHLPRSVPILLTREPGGAREPSFSPDGRLIAFRYGHDGIGLMTSSGGAPRKIAEHGQRPRFSPDGKTIAYSVGELWSGYSRIYTLAPTGGPPRLMKRDCGFAAGSPVWSPDSKHLLFWCDGMIDGVRTADWWVMSLATGQAVRTGAFALLQHRSLKPPYQYFEPEAWIDNRIVFSARLDSSVGLWTMPVTPGTWICEHEPLLISSTSHAETQASLVKPARSPATMAFATFTQNIDVWSLPVQGNVGKVDGALQRLTQNPARDYWPSASADGKTVAFVSDRSGAFNVWVKDLSTGTERALAPGIEANLAPRISMDGRKVVFSSLQDGKRILYIVDVQSSGNATPLKFCDDCGYPWAWTPDGKAILTDVVYDLPKFSAAQFGFYWIDVASTRRALLQTREYSVEPRISPDSRWVALYSVNTPETRQIFIAPFHAQHPGPPALGPRTTWITITDGKAIDRNPAWSPEGNVLYFQSERDGFRCIWAQRLHPQTKRPVEAAFAVYHSHDARLSLANAGHETATGLSVASDKLVFSQGERTGAIWVTAFR